MATKAGGIHADKTQRDPSVAPEHSRAEAAPELSASPAQGAGIASGQATITVDEDSPVAAPDSPSPEHIQVRQNPLQAVTGLAVPRPTHFSVGSSRADVIAVQGKPDSQTDRILTYRLSTVLLDDTGLVTAWTDASKNLIVK